MFEFDRSIAEDWFENHTRNGGKIYTADFRDYYEEHYISKVNNIPIAMVIKGGRNKDNDDT